MMIGKYMRAAEVRLPPERKTNEWHIHSANSGEVLGEVKWYGAWRQYCFFPHGFDTVFNHACLRDLAEFVQHETLSHHDALKVAPA